MLSKDEKLAFLNSRIQLEKDLMTKLKFIYKDDEKTRDEEKEKSKFMIGILEQAGNRVRFYAVHGFL